MINIDSKDLVKGYDLNANKSVSNKELVLLTISIGITKRFHLQIVKYNCYILQNK